MINVLIRTALAYGYDKEVLAVVTRLRSRSLNYPGYVSSEIVWSQENQQFVWITKWHTRESWKAWRMSEDCKSLLRKLQNLGCTVSFEVLAYPEVEMRKNSRRVSERRKSNDPNYQGPERRSGKDRRISDRRKPRRG